MNTNKKIDLLWNKLKRTTTLVPRDCPTCGHRTLCEEVNIIFRDDKPQYAAPADMGELCDWATVKVMRDGYSSYRGFRCLSCGTTWKDSYKSYQEVIELNKR